MLNHARATKYEPGSNTKGAVGGANWTFLLPTLEVSRVLCIGTPTAGELRTFLRLAKEVVVIGKPRATAASKSTTRVRYQDACGSLADRSVDVAALSGPDGAARMAGDRKLITQLSRVLTPEGVVYVESGRWRDRLFGHRQLAELAKRFARAETLWVTPLVGRETSTAVPTSDMSTRKYFREERIACPSTKRPVLRSVESTVLKGARLARLSERQAGLFFFAEQESQNVPRYLRQLAGECGVELARYRWGLSAKGRYESRKVLFYLFAQASNSPDLIVKITRQPALNARLENEHRALTELESCGSSVTAHVPRAAFMGHHGGLAILGQTVMAGEPFDAAIGRGQGDSAAAGVIDFLINLGAATREIVSADTAADAMADLVTRLAGIYRLDAPLREFLDRQIDTLARTSAPVPVVAQHGDPGVWNILHTGVGGPSVLDWEAFESQGAPLWDLWYFLRSYTVRATDGGGSKRSLAALAQQWLDAGSLGKLAAEATAHYCDRLAVADELVVPLFYACWVHRALKESTRRRPAQLESGHYINLLRLLASRQSAVAALLGQHARRGAAVSS